MTTGEKDLPSMRYAFASGALLLTISLCGCTSASLDQAAASLDDPSLPETMAVVPGGRDELGDDNRSVASALAAAASEEAGGFTAVGYAGPTPSDGAIERPSDVLIAKQAIAARSPELDALIARYAQVHGIPEQLLRRVVNRESTFNPSARNGPYWGLMQILPATARTMGYDGSPEGLLDAETNLKYAGKYLRGAYITAGGDHDQAVRFYARGYYYDAKRKGLLEETGLRPTRSRLPKSG